MLKKIIKNWQILTVVSLATAFFILASSFNYLTQKDNFIKWASPDETANYFFTKNYATTGGLVVAEKYNLISDNIIHPRSFRAEYDQLKPMSFLGIILIYGNIARIAGVDTIPYLTPLFGAIGIIFFYLLVKELFDQRIGLIAASLLAAFPPFIYYSSRSMFHNVLFVVLLIAGFYFSLLMNKNQTDKKHESPLDHILKNFIYPALSGGIIGLAIITRTSELLWLGPTLLFLWLANIRNTGFIKLAVFLCFAFLSILPVLNWNQVLYASPTNSGYPEMNTSISAVSSAGSQLAKETINNVNKGKLAVNRILFEKIKNTIFYFGLNPYQSLKMFYYYFYLMFAWLFWGATAGFIVFLLKYKKISKGQICFILSLILLSTILLFYYGSWKFHDNPDPNAKTIGNSYTRYWLPIYLGAIPFASLLIVRLSRVFKFKFLINTIRLVAVAAIMIYSVNFIMFYSEESLTATIKKQQATRQEFDEVIKNTPENAVIISRYHDKLFFPERKVILGLFNDDNMNMAYAKLAKYVPLYYYNFTFGQKDLDYLNKTKLAKAGLKIKQIKKVNENFTLYKLSSVIPNPLYGVKDLGAKQ